MNGIIQVREKRHFPGSEDAGTVTKLGSDGHTGCWSLEEGAPGMGVAQAQARGWEGKQHGQGAPRRSPRSVLGSSQRSPEGQGVSELEFDYKGIRMSLEKAELASVDTGWFRTVKSCNGSGFFRSNVAVTGGVT